MNLRDNYKYTHISAAATTVVESAPCVLVSIIVNTTVASTITIYDNVTATAPVVGILQASYPALAIEYKARMLNGLTIVTAGASDITVITSQAPF